jgi:LPXTG-motif cell wall anchor domain protein
MTNKKFSIRKLAVGTASVAIGFSASGTIDSTLANDYTNNYIATTNTTNTSNNYTVTTNPSNNYMYNSYNNRNHPLSPEEYTLKQAKDRALEEIQPYKELYKDNNYISGFIPEEAKELFNYIDKIDKSTSESEISNLLQELKNNEQNKFNTFLSSLNNLNTEELKELNITVTDKIARYKALALNSLHAIPNITIDDFKKYKDEIEKEPYKIDSPSNHKRYIESVKEEITRKYLVKDIYNSNFLSNKNKSEFLKISSEISEGLSIHLINYSFNTIKKLSENKDISNARKEALMTELIKAFDYNSEDYSPNSDIIKIKVYHLLSVIRSLNEQYEIKNNINNESKPEESKTIPEYELSLSNKKVIAYDFLKGLTYPTLEKLRADIINATEEDIYSLSHKASAIKQINSLKTLNSNDKARYINEILEVDLQSDLSTIIGKVLENDIIETSNLSDKHKNRLKEILNSLPQTNYGTFSDIISSALAINESKDLSSEEKEAFFDEFINKYTSPNNQATPRLDYETLSKMGVSILINKLSYLTDEDKKLYKEKVSAQKPGLGFAGGAELEYSLGFFNKDAILNHSESILESIKEFDAYKEAVAKNEELRKKKESEPTFDSKTENADIPFETIYKDDNTLDKGKEVTETEGINGVKEITTTYTVINGIRQDNPKVEEKVTKEKTDKVVRRGTKVTSSETEKSTQNIPFETIYKEDNTLDKGTEVVTTEGINGVKEITTTYIIINGVRQDNPKVEEKVTKEKVDKVVRRGTKVTSSETEKSTQNIPFETIYKDDNSLDKGKEVVITEGINGTKEITTTFTVINGVRQDNPKIEEKVTKDKVDKVVRRGTKVSTTATPELPNNTNKPISPISNDSKPNTVTPTDKPVNSSANDSKPNTTTPTNKPVNPSTDNNKPNIVAPTDKPAVDNSKPTLANITLENINNDISITLATAETGVKLVTDEVTNPTTLNEVKEKITNENNSITSTTDITNLRVVDLTLEKEGKKYSTNTNRTVRIALLNNEKGNEILVYHVKDNGELEELTKEKNNLTITNDNVEFTINHFSKFAIASIKKNIPTPSTNTSEEYNKNKDNRRDLTDIKPSESNQNKILPKTGVSSSSTVLLGATLLSLALISRKLKKN